MRRTFLCLLAALCVPVPAASPAQAQGAPPHAWLFGTWSGGIFPVPANMPPQACLSQPVVVFTQDLVLRATLTEQTLVQRVIESARAAPGGTEFRFAATGAAPSTALSPSRGGFGCEAPDVLHVQRRGENEISFPGCADFPNPLVRCHTR